MPNAQRDQAHQDAQMSEDTTARERMGLREDDDAEGQFDLTESGAIQENDTSNAF